MSQGPDSFDSFGLEDVDPDVPGSRGGRDKLPEAGYEFCVTEVIIQNEKGDTEVECEVVKAKDAALVGRKHKEFLRWPKPEYQDTGKRIAKETLLAWCYAAKTTTPEEIKVRQQARQGFDPGWLEAMVGRQVLGFVKVESYTDKAGNTATSAKIEGRVWSLDNPKGKGIPGWIDTGKPAASAPATAAPAPPVTTPSVPATDPFAGLV